MAKVTPQKKVSSHQPHYLHADQIALIASLLDHFDGLAIATDGKGRIVYVNRSALKTCGFKRSDITGQSLQKLFNLTARQQTSIQRCLDEKSAVSFETTARTKSGATFAVQVKAAPLNPAADDCGLAVFAVDVSGFKRTIEEQARLVTAVEHTAESIIVTDPAGKIEYVNPAFEKITGYARNEVIGSDIGLLDSGQKSKTFFSSIIDTLQRGEIWQGRLVNKRSDHSLYETEATVSPIKNKSGEITNYVSVQRDVSHEVRLDRQLRQAQKMEAIGTLAGGIAHDFNNLLMGIQGNISLSLLDIDPGSPYVKNLNKIEQYIQNGVDLTKQLLGFARGGKYEISLLNLNELLEEQNLMFSRTNKEIIFENELNPDLWRVGADRGQIEQVLMNLYLNALQAMPDGGTLTTRTANVTIDEDHYSPYYVKAGRYIRMTIEDTGIGMDEDIQQRIFDPFFTTKEMGRGTGLGLASVYGIVKNHEGFINVFSKTGQGTRFEVYLPSTDKGVPAKEKIVEEFVEGQETVLLVDDEDMIIDVGTRMLKKLGYKVFAARDGKEAIAVFKKHLEEIDVIVLDMIMPQMGGGETYDQIKKIKPGVKVLLSSGYSITGQASEILNRGCNGFIQKPFNLQNLSQNLRAILEGK
ncbi:MAG: PAS domain S-box protein [Deltaproteobacteria bacterium]|jgi:PAS domain S-box-containing protein|nr:PAS domain S-box protein [Deltaproteobacteria bacterium]